MDPLHKQKITPFSMECKSTARIVWWRFFDWLAVTSWRSFFGISFLFLILGGMIGLGSLPFFLICISILIKSLAGGKRRSDIAAENARARANVEALERRVLEAEMATLQAQIEPHFLFNTLALIGQLIETNPSQASIVQII